MKKFLLSFIFITLSCFASEKEYFEAIENLDTTKVEQLIKQNPALVNAKNEFGTTALNEMLSGMGFRGLVETNIIAEAERNMTKNQKKLDISKILIMHGADINCLNRASGSYPIDEITPTLNLNWIELFLQYGANPNKAYFFLNNLDAYHRHKEKATSVLKLLLEYGANLQQMKISTPQLVRNFVDDSFNELIKEYREKLALPENQKKLRQRITNQLQRSNLTINNQPMPKDLLNIIAEYTIDNYQTMPAKELLDTILKIRMLIDDLPATHPLMKQEIPSPLTEQQMREALALMDQELGVLPEEVEQQAPAYEPRSEGGAAAAP